MLGNKMPRPGVTGFAMRVQPTKEHLVKAISMDGFCRPDKCWHYVAINQIIELWEPGVKHHVRVDAGHVRMNYRGWRYTADAPRHVKHSLMLFDKKLYDRVHVRPYTLRFHRTSKIIKVTKERQEQIETARQKRIKAGTENYIPKPMSLRQRVEGFSGIV